MDKGFHHKWLVFDCELIERITCVREFEKMMFNRDYVRKTRTDKNG